jgi:hypothetical protein
LPGAALGGLHEGPEGPDLYRYLATELNKLGLAYIHLMHLGDDALLAGARYQPPKALEEPTISADARRVNHFGARCDTANSPPPAGGSRRQCPKPDPSLPRCAASSPRIHPRRA